MYAAALSVCVRRLSTTPHVEAVHATLPGKGYHPELSLTGWRFNHRIVESGTNWDKILAIVENDAASMTPENMVVAVHR